MGMAVGMPMRSMTVSFMLMVSMLMTAMTVLHNCSIFKNMDMFFIFLAHFILHPAVWQASPYAFAHFFNYIKSLYFCKGAALFYL